MLLFPGQPGQSVSKMHYIPVMVLVQTNWCLKRNPNLPSNLNNLLTVLEGMSQTDIIVKHLNALHEANKAFIEAESNEKLHQVLKAKNLVTAGIIYEIGDIVYYKCKESKKWKCPAKVIGKEHKHASKAC